MLITPLVFRASFLHSINLFANLEHVYIVFAREFFCKAHKKKHFEGDYARGAANFCHHLKLLIGID